MSNTRIFLDYASSTPVAPEVLEAMMPWFGDKFANPSALYKEALEAKEAVHLARQKIAEIIGCPSTNAKEIVFTSGGTEGNNLAIQGVYEMACMQFLQESRTGMPHIITSNIEHPAVLEVCRDIEKRGGEVTYLPVSEDGFVSAKQVREALKENTVLVSVMYANNEIGTVQPIHEIGRVIKDWRQKNNSEFPYFHTDACQALLYLPVHVLKLGVDMMTFDGLKIYGPRGVGCLYVHGDVVLRPVAFGGGQERGLRSGTENVSGIVGLAKAFEIAESMREKENEVERICEIRDFAISEILSHFPQAKINGFHEKNNTEKRLANNINICLPAQAGFPNVDAEFAVISLDIAGIACSYSSSCLSLKEDSSSYVVESLGGLDCKNSSLRFTLGRETKKGDIEKLVEALKKIMK